MREIPTYIQKMGIQSMPIVQYSTAGANTTMRASQELGAFAQNMQENSQKVERLRAQATMREEMHRMSREYGSDPAALQQGLEKYRGEFIANLPAGMQAEFNEIYRLESVSHIDAASNKYNANLRDNMQVEGLRNFTAASNNLKLYAKMLEQAETPEQREAAAAGFQSTLQSMDEIAKLNDVDGNIFSPEQQLKMLSEGVAAPITAMSPQGQLLALNPPAGFEANLPLIHSMEIDPRDPDKVHPDGKGMAYRGINSDANPQVFNQIQGLLNKGDTAGARALADATYKKKYWDDVGIDQLPPQYHAIIFDASVNQGEGYAKQLVKEVEKGAQPSEILAMREERYRKTNGNDAEKRSWANRIKKLTPIAMGENKDMIPIEYRERLDKGVKDAMERDRKLMIEDYQLYAQQNNIDPITAMQQQAQMNPYRLPSIMSKPQAEQVAKELSTIQDYKQVIQMADQVPTEFEENYYSDLLQAKAPTSVIMAMQAVRKSPAYVKHAEYATLYTRPDPDNADIKKEDILKARGFDPKLIGAGVMAKLKSERLEDLMRNELNDGFAQSSIDNTANGIYGIAAGYLLANPNSSIDTAVEFAMQPLFHDFVLSRVNGYDIRVPKEDKEAPIVSKLEGYVRDKAYQIPKDIEGADVDWEEMYPVYNPKKRAYDIVTRNSGLVYNKQGKPLTISINDLMTYETTQERLAKLPYAEREKLRAEIFEFESDRQKRINQGISEKLAKPAGSL